MEIKFLGPLGKVTGSCCWMRDVRRGWNFLIDCGMQQGEPTAKAWNACNWPFNPGELDFVVLTHAHVDHSGLVPALYKKGFTGPVYATRETQELADFLLKDATRFQDCPFDRRDVERIRWKEPASRFLLGRHHPINQDLFLQFFRTGHVVGAVSAAIYWGAPGENQRSIVFSGDIGPNAEDSETLPFLRHCMYPGHFDYAVLESTYGGVERTVDEVSPEGRRNGLRRWVDRTIDSNGVLVIPAFSLGRTQDIMFDLHWIVAENPGRYGDVSFLLDSPSGSKINDIVLRSLARTEQTSTGKVRPLWLGKQMFRWFGLEAKNPAHAEHVIALCQMALGQGPTTEVTSPVPMNTLGRKWRRIFSHVENRNSLSDHGLSKKTVLVVSSGTADGGPAAFWLSRLLCQPTTSVAFPGYCAPSTVGGKLLSLAGVSIQERAMLSEPLKWQDSNAAEVKQSSITAAIGLLSGYSAHADQAGLLRWAFNGPRSTAVAGTIFLQHGEDQKREALAKALKSEALRTGQILRVASPTPGTPWLNLDNGADAVNRQEEEELLRAQILQLQETLSRIQSCARG